MTTVLWGRRNAYNVMKVDCLLRELALPFEHREIGSTPGDLDTPAFRRLNPFGRVPVLQIDGNCLRESNSICRYLAERTEDTAWWPADPVRRVHINAWLDRELASWQPVFMDLFWGYYRCPASARNLRAVDAAAARCAVGVNALETALHTQDWLCGDALSIADICCSVGFHRYRHMGYDVELPGGVSRWLERLAKRPAWQATAMAPFSDLNGRTDF